MKKISALFLVKSVVAGWLLFIFPIEGRSIAIGTLDSDFDGVANWNDNCPCDSNPDQADSDGDGWGDACDPDDNDPGFPSSSWSDLDSDGDYIPDGCDPCPDDPFNFCVDVNSRPTAAAGQDQMIRSGDEVFLHGNGSFDDNTPGALLVYSWTFFELPPGSETVLSGADTASPSFTADVAGTYIMKLIVTDEGGLESEPDYIVVSSDNLAPTAVPLVDLSLVIIGETAALDGSGSSDPESDPLTFSWTLMAPEGSLSVLDGASTANPSLTPDIEGVYLVTLEVSDFIGPGAAVSITVTATTASEFAEIAIVESSDILLNLTETGVTTLGNQHALNNSMSQAIVALQEDDVEEAINKLRKAMTRTDGCVLRDDPDGNGPGRDWITDCEAQAQLYAAMTSALNALLE